MTSNNFRPSSSAQTSLATAGTNFTKPRTRINFGPSTFYQFYIFKGRELNRSDNPLASNKSVQHRRASSNPNICNLSFTQLNFESFHIRRYSAALIRPRCLMLVNRLRSTEDLESCRLRSRRLAEILLNSGCFGTDIPIQKDNVHGSAKRRSPRFG